MEIIIAPIHQTFFSGKIWMGLDIEKIKQDLVGLNAEYKVQIIDFSIIANNYSIIPQHAVLFYTASYSENYQQYIKDVILDFSVTRPDVVLLPNLQQLFSFENKGYQELVKRRLNIENVKGKYYGDIDDYLNDKQKTTAPFVYKTLNGAMSSGVVLIKSIEQLLALDRQYKKKSFIEKIKYLKRERAKTDPSNSDVLNLKPNLNYSRVNFKEFFSKRNPFIIQNFVPNLECDYKVLVFGLKYYVLKRAIRENDFRASGSGKFQWVKPPTEILDYAHEIQSKLNAPFISLDLGIDSLKKVHLFEFQGIGFGPLTLINSISFFCKTENNWDEKQLESNLEFEYANAIHYHIQKAK